MIGRDVTLPNFILIGAMKAGTTSLYHYLRQHPEIFMSPKKEPQFFAYEGWHPDLFQPQTDVSDPEVRGRLEPHMVSEWDDYRALFSGADGETAIGQASAHYLHLPRAIDRIRHYIPDVHLFAVLRHPADRAYSSFLHMRHTEAEPIEDFAAALAQEDERVRQDQSLIWAYRRLGFYAEPVRQYLEAFDPAHIRFYLYEDLTIHPRALLKDIFAYLGVDSEFEPDISTRYNISSVAKNRTLLYLLRGIRLGSPLYRPLVPPERRQHILHALQKHTHGPPPEMPIELRAALTAGYRDDILKLQDLIDRDLSHWLDCEKGGDAKTPARFAPIGETASGGSIRQGHA